MSTSKARILFHAIFALLPSVIKVPCYRFFWRYKIGRGVKIGCSVISADICEIGDGVTFGHLNLLIGTKKLRIGEKTRIGHLNIIRGGEEVSIGRYAEIIRLNEINSIPDPIVLNPVDSRFLLGDGSVITTSHKIDFTDRVEIGNRSILGGRNSSLWTHNRRTTESIEIGDYCYIGSEIRIAPGGKIPSSSVVGMGSVITGKLDGEYNLFGGVPAKTIKALDDEGIELTRLKTRMDLPDEIQ